MLENDQGKKVVLREVDYSGFKDPEESTFSDSDLANLLSLSKEIKCVVLNSCYSNSLAETITQKIPAVVGMTGPIGDLAAIAFAKGFYDAILNSLSLEAALASGRLQMKLEKRGESYKPEVKTKGELLARNIYFISTERTEHDLQQEQTRIKWTEAEGKYINRVEENCGKVFVLGQANLKPIDDIYTALNLLQKVTALERYAADKLHELFLERHLLYDKHERCDGVKIVEQGNNLFILGKPGAGKTTFLKHIAIKAVRHQLNFNNPKMPIFLSLHSYSYSDKELFDFIGQELQINNFPKSKQFLEQLLHSGNALVLFDGLDEVKEEGKLRSTTIKKTKRFYEHLL